MFEVYTWKCPDDNPVNKNFGAEKNFQIPPWSQQRFGRSQKESDETKPLPNLREAVSKVQSEENRKKLMMGSQNSTPTLEGSAFVARGPPNTTMIVNKEEEDPGVIIEASEDMPEKSAGKSMANLLIVCAFQDLVSRKKIGRAKMCSGLYLLDDATPTRQSQNAICVPSKSRSALNSHVNKDSEVML